MRGKENDLDEPDKNGRSRINLRSFNLGFVSALDPLGAI